MPSDDPRSRSLALRTTVDHLLAPADTRRVVVIDPATDNVTTIIGKTAAAPGVETIRARVANLNQRMWLFDASYRAGVEMVLGVILSDAR